MNDFHETPQEVKARRKIFLPQLEKEGFIVIEITPSQYRINNRLDIYPKNARWHDIKKNKRGSFYGRNLGNFVRGYFTSNNF